jgi:N-acetylglucosamine-6-sulfatase
LKEVAFGTEPESAPAHRTNRRRRIGAEEGLSMVSGVRALTAAAVVSLLGSLVASLTTSPSEAVPPAAPAAVSAPNIVVVMTDDMRADELRFLPAVRKLRRSGIAFTRALSADSLCCPARATLLTGKLAHNHQTVGNNVATHGGYQFFAEHNDIEDLLPQWLHDAGYRTSWIGKYLNELGAREDFDQPDWNYFAPAVNNVYNYWTSGFSINGRFHQERGYREVYARHLLLDRIRAWAPSSRPFFVLYSSLAPHKKRSADGGWTKPAHQRRHDGFRARRLSVRPSVGETDLSDKPDWLQAYAERLGGPRTYPRDFERHRVEALMSVNDTVRELVATLRHEHELSQTLVVFTSDNGFMLHEHNLTDKNKAYDESVHVPLVVRGPGFLGGARVGSTVSLADVTAMILRSAGVSGTHDGDGVPLQDVLADQESFGRRPVEIEGSAAQYPLRTTLPTDPLGRFYTGAVWGSYSLVHYETGDWEFYDRGIDPWQLRNSYTEHPTRGSPQALLQEWYDEHVDCAGSACSELLPTP